MAASESPTEGGDGAGVLLYYKYAPVPDITSLVHFYESNCRSLALLGRVRIAPDGVNVTVGGSMPSLEKHIAAVKSMSLFEGTDFKLASCDHPSDDKIAKECGYCTGGIRCETASAYIKSKGAGFENVFQVSFIWKTF
ncbi:hypothetical protein GW17_00010574 [Ensete ventricosum]|uniref:Uncharacterized protein n=1 Tax=Ensete ventricosum TaxID=4639 RepID=A0A444FR49_ENSVE|nr:hypothetical protein GW17_00010574 [Ensete ventricosum]RZR71104.1 hypothetical protein BHM03_00003626 [Ensete ventricosum]